MTQLDFYRDIDTSLEINGPTLSFTLQPTGAFGNYNGSVQLVGIATAKFTQETVSYTHLTLPTKA